MGYTGRVHVGQSRAGGPRDETHWEAGNSGGPQALQRLLAYYAFGDERMRAPSMDFGG